MTFELFWSSLLSLGNFLLKDAATFEGLCGFNPTPKDRRNGRSGVCEDIVVIGTNTEYLQIFVEILKKLVILSTHSTKPHTGVLKRISCLIN